MASSMMHLAVVQEMKKKIRFQNAERLDLGVILPDAAVRRKQPSRKEAFAVEQKIRMIWNFFVKNSENK